MSILFVSSNAGNGGAEKYLDRLLQLLGPEWTQSVVCLKDGPLVSTLRARGIEVDVLPTSSRWWSFAASAWRLRRLVRRRRPSVVHANGVKAALVASYVPAPMVWVKHDYSRDGLLARFALRRSARVIGVSKAVTETFGDREAERVRVIHNGVARTTMTRAEGKRRLAEAIAPAEASAIVMVVGRLDPYKGHLDVLSALPKLQSRVPGVRAVFVGGPARTDPAFAEHLRDETTRLGLAGVVTFLGHRDDAVALIAGADIVTITSRRVGRFGREGLPYVALEALMVGTPVVAYDAGGTPEAVGNCGLLVPEGDSDALADAFARVLTDRALRTRLEKCGPERVARKFSEQRMVSETIRVYREVAAG